MDRLFCSTGADGDSLVVKEPNSTACLCFKDHLPARAGCELVTCQGHASCRIPKRAVTSCCHIPGGCELSHANASTSRSGMRPLAP